MTRKIEESKPLFCLINPERHTIVSFFYHTNTKRQTLHTLCWYIAGQIQHNHIGLEDPCILALISRTACATLPTTILPYLYLKFAANVILLKQISDFNVIASRITGRQISEQHIMHNREPHFTMASRFIACFRPYEHLWWHDVNQTMHVK